MSEEKEPARTFSEKLRDYIPFFTSMLMIAGIGFTYYTYFYDVQKLPALLVENSMTKIDETENFYIIKMNVRIINKSKSLLEVIANQGKLYSLRCGLNTDNSSDEEFLNKIIDSVEYAQENLEFEPIEINKNIECDDRELIGFYQPTHNASWLLPEETITSEIISAVSKTFDKVSFFYRIDYGLSEENIFPKYVKETDGEVNYKIFVINEKDSTKIHQLNYEDPDDIKLIKKNIMAISATKTDLWLSNTDAVKNTLKK